MKKVKVTPSNFIWLFDKALRSDNKELIKEVLEYGRWLETERVHRENFFEGQKKNEL